MLQLNLRFEFPMELFQPAQVNPVFRQFAVPFLFAFALYTQRGAAGPIGSAEPELIYLEPRVLTGAIYDPSDPEKLLFRFRRTATNSSGRIHVVRNFTLPDGRAAAREEVVYNGNQLVSFRIEELQLKTTSSASIQRDRSNTNRTVIRFEHQQASTRKADEETFEPNTLISDMVAPFISRNWSALTNGSVLKVRLVALSRTETVGFKLMKDSFATLNGRPVARIRMEPASFVVAQFVEPLTFTVERDAPHRVLQYFGRTTPSILRNGRWEDLDALTVFDWDAPR